uniref:LysR family transcriptional regulator n=1 Tax=Pararhizobium sp. IMCC3301 TaxID=3067904 RepID=UPI0027405271|nr:LysR family transcriptional regulator [Pararhizobium sp. IMCC3301]
MSTKNNERPDIRTLEAFTAVVSCGSMTGAAQMLQISQPAVTRMIRVLENQVGFNLFERNGPKISPTDKGMLFFEESRRVIANLTHLTNRAHAIRDGRIAAIDIVATPTMSAGLVASILARVKNVLPDFVHVETTSAERVVHALRQRTADLGFSAFPLEHERLECLERFESTLVALVQEGGPHDIPEPLSLTVFAKERLATVGNSYRIRHAINRSLDDQGVTPAYEFVTNSSINAAMAARAGLGIGICDPVTAYGVPISGVSIRPIAKPIPYSWGLFAADAKILGDQLNLVTEAFAIESKEIIRKVEGLPVCWKSS